MRVRLAYTHGTLSICRAHYQDPPEWCPPLGPIGDSRDQAECAICSEERIQAARERDQRRTEGRS